MVYEEREHPEEEYMESEEFEVTYLPRGTMLEIDVQEDALPEEVDKSQFLVRGRDTPEGERVFDRLHLYFVYLTDKFDDENGTHKGGESVFVDTTLQTKGYISNESIAFTEGFVARVYGGMSLGNNPVPLKDNKPQNTILRMNLPGHLSMIPLE